jgi:uroporphyrinogen III methyltransferase/synthase
VTRTREQAGALAALLAEAGAEVVECPAIALAPAEDPPALDRALDRLASYDWLVFTSANGVARFFARLDETGRDARALHRSRIAAEGLLARLGGEGARGKRFLLPRAAGARPILPDELRAAGAEVDEVATYRSVVPEESVALLARVLEERPPDVLTFTSSSTVTHFVALLDRAAPGTGRARVAGACVACIGPITAATAREAGLRVDVVPSAYTVPALAAAVSEHFAHGLRGAGEVPGEVSG